MYHVYHRLGKTIPILRISLSSLTTSQKISICYVWKMTRLLFVCLDFYVYESWLIDSGKTKIQSTAVTRTVIVQFIACNMDEIILNIDKSGRVHSKIEWRKRQKKMPRRKVLTRKSINLSPIKSWSNRASNGYYCGPILYMSYRLSIQLAKL